MHAHTLAEHPCKPSSLERKASAQVSMRLLAVLAFLTLVAPAAAAAADNDLYASFRTNANGHTRGHNLEVSQLLALLILLAQYGVAASGALVGPLMGITGVLWLIMRNDAAIDPKLSWMVFGLWSLAILTYFMLQCHRVGNHRLYILVTVSIASTCVFLVALTLVQRTSFQGGLVTVIPPCASFAAYMVAYFFPERRRVATDPEILSF
ncbi:hypothetical protein DE146DRAFT_771336 [Phaeosphaeria sp. MPI-PUGE-AT-0046c]|nr:hypothetical protein DE146DRAFT_771336 [Phaeosphaeria sp. MPI-PUGE-AT-0046c]